MLQNLISLLDWWGIESKNWTIPLKYRTLSVPWLVCCCTIFYFHWVDWAVHRKVAQPVALTKPFRHGFHMFWPCMWLLSRYFANAPPTVQKQDCWLCAMAWITVCPALHCDRPANRPGFALIFPYSGLPLFCRLQHEDHQPTPTTQLALPSSQPASTRTHRQKSKGLRKWELLRHSTGLLSFVLHRCTYS